MYVETWLRKSWMVYYHSECMNISVQIASAYFFFLSLLEYLSAWQIMLEAVSATHRVSYKGV